MKKIIVIGCPGSGKSSFSRALHVKTGIPLYHLDMLFWNSDKTTVEKRLFLDRMSAVMSQDRWILDGNYSSTLEERLTACDTVFFLDYPTDICLGGIRARQGQPRSDLPWIETEEDAEFIAYIESFYDRQRPLILALLDKHKDKNRFIFTGREQADAYLNGTNGYV